MSSIRFAAAAICALTLSATAALAEGTHYFAYNSHSYSLWYKYATCESELGSNCVKAIYCGTQWFGHKNTHGMVETIHSRGEDVTVRENWGKFEFVCRG